MENDTDQKTIFVVKAEIYGTSDITFYPYKSPEGAQKKFIEVVKKHFSIDDLLSASMYCELDSHGGLLQMNGNGSEYSQIAIEEIVLHD